MPEQTVFISSTYKDLKEYRRQVWDALKRFDVSVRGMEEFGARTAGPLDTCLAEVEESDVYVGIIAYRLGSIDPASKKPFTILEYEKAVEQKKEILLYLADDETSAFPVAVVDEDVPSRERLAAFKKTLRERHTVNAFSTAEDLVEKLSRDFKKRFLESQPPADQKTEEPPYAKTAATLRAFRLTPKRYNGQEIRLSVAFYGSLFPASRTLCQRFNLDYGFTIGAYFNIIEPADKDITTGFREIYAVRNKVDTLRSLFQTKNADLYAQLQFSEEDVKRVQAEFLGRTYHDDPEEYLDPYEVYLAPEGKIIMLLTKPA